MVKIANGVYGIDSCDHGGHCCGINHLYSFPAVAKVSHDDKVRAIKSAVGNVLDEYDIDGEEDDDGDWIEGSVEKAREEWAVAIEAVLIDIQLPCWQKALEDVGFKEVLSFKNSNSGNVCHVFYLVTGE